MMRTSITLPAQLHQRIVLTAKAEGKNMVQMIRELVEESLVKKEKDHIAHSYQALDKLVGIFKDDNTNLASSIDEVLYGENGAWKGDYER
jgi:predicted DNA-binding protein